MIRLGLDSAPGLLLLSELVQELQAVCQGLLLLAQLFQFGSLPLHDLRRSSGDESFVAELDFGAFPFGDNRSSR